MREAVVLALCLSACAKAQPFSVSDIEDLAAPGIEEDLAATWMPDLVTPLPDLSGSPPDLAREERSGADRGGQGGQAMFLAAQIGDRRRPDRRLA